MPISIDNLMSLNIYLAGRKQFQPGLIDHRRRRTVMLGEYMRVQFEDEMTLRYQVLEMLRVEGINVSVDRAAIQSEMETWAHLLPDATNLKATLLIECPDASRRLRELPLLDRAARHLYLAVADLPRAYAHTNEDIDDADQRLSAVHFLRFPITLAMRDALLAGAPAMLGCAHPQHTINVAIAAPTLDCLRGDLTRHASSLAKVSLPQAEQVPA